MPVYLVKSPSGETLVDASNRNSAINHVIKNQVSAEAMTPSEIVTKIQDEGMTVETAGQQKDVGLSRAVLSESQPAPVGESVPTETNQPSGE